MQRGVFLISRITIKRWVVDLKKNEDEFSESKQIMTQPSMEMVKKLFICICVVILVVFFVEEKLLNTNRGRFISSHPPLTSRALHENSKCDYLR